MASTTEGKAGAWMVLVCMLANNFSRQGSMPPPMVGMTMSRERK